jgi:hypothetical protein
VGVLGLALNVAVTVVWTLRTPESAGSPGGRRVAA